MNGRYFVEVIVEVPTDEGQTRSHGVHLVGNGFGDELSFGGLSGVASSVGIAVDVVDVQVEIVREAYDHANDSSCG